MKTLLFGLLCVTVLLGGCGYNKEIQKAQVTSYCKGLGYSGGYIYYIQCIDVRAKTCYSTEYKYYCYNNIQTGSFIDKI